MKKIVAGIIIANLILMLAGCVTMPTYQPQDINKTVVMNVKDANQVSTPMICTDKGWNNLQVDTQGDTRIPYGKRINIGTYFSNSDDLGTYVKTETCTPTISFIPRENEKYYLNFLVNNGSCGLEILRYSPTNKIGLVREHTARFGEPCGNANKN